jgi:protein SCO1/2
VGSPEKEPGTPPRIDPRERDAFPDVEVVAHTGERLRFYEDLVKDKIALVNFMSIRGEAFFPVTANLAKVAERLGDRLGRDVLMSSITRDIGYDTPQRLKAFADAHRVPRGWRFLTGTQSVTTALATRLYRCLSSPDTICRAPGNRKFVDVVFYGNGGIGLWSAFPGLIDPDDAASRIAWVMPGQKPTGPIRRAGPRRLSANERSSHNRET